MMSIINKLGELKMPRKTNSLPSPEKLHELFVYDPNTGSLRWRKANCNKIHVGDEVGYTNFMGYKQTYVNGERHLLHRIIYCMMTGEIPDPQKDIDHINGDPSDNRWNNLRLVSRAVNARNRPNNQDQGIDWNKITKKWCARIVSNGVCHGLGCYKRKTLAVFVVSKAREFLANGASIKEMYRGINTIRKANGLKFIYKKDPVYRCVSWDKTTGKWLARINADYKRYNLGYYSDIQLAVIIVANAKRKLSAGARTMFRAVNEIRHKHGMPPLKRQVSA